jgi:uncharacterized membrane protein YdbT with pleckstrin-like domain
MSFIQKNLAANETVLYQTKLHWWVFVTGGIILLLGILFMGQSNGFGGFLILISLIMLGAAYLNWSSSEFVITNKRVILKTGFLRRRLVEIQLNKAEGLVVEQGIIGRMLNFGGVLVTSGGVQNAFAPMAAPFVFKKEVNEAVENHTVQR